jgi:hypothetical protein
MTVHIPQAPLTRHSSLAAIPGSVHRRSGSPKLSQSASFLHGWPNMARSSRLTRWPLGDGHMPLCGSYVYAPPKRHATYACNALSPPLFGRQCKKGKTMSATLTIWTSRISLTSRMALSRISHVSNNVVLAEGFSMSYGMPRRNEIEGSSLVSA